MAPKAGGGGDPPQASSMYNAKNLSQDPRQACETGRAMRDTGTASREKAGRRRQRWCRGRRLRQHHRRQRKRDRASLECFPQPSHGAGLGHHLESATPRARLTHSAPPSSSPSPCCSKPTSAHPSRRSCPTWGPTYGPSGQVHTCGAVADFAPPLTQIVPHRGTRIVPQRELHLRPQWANSHAVPAPASAHL